ncbi:MAG: hypothetical protein JST00_12380 [Deltaproteobacteria bacterium]|nr:hypothetical protein [Deltaproteobacteria bacterium]
MKSPRGKKLAAAFVVTVAATGCKKQPVVEPEGTSGEGSASIFRNGNVCRMAVPVHCPRGATCNPPPPLEIDCPPDHRDAGEPDPSPARPPGKEGWIRVRPHLWAYKGSCSYNAPYFCAPQGKPFKCEQPPQGLAFVSPKCSGVDAGATPIVHIESFVAYDGIGTCVSVPAFDCPQGTDCIDKMPAGSPVPCPK